MQKRENTKAPAISNAIAAILLIFFLHSALYTWKQFVSFKNMLGFYTTNTSAIAWTVIIVELVTAVLLFLPKTRKTGFMLAALFGITGIVIIQLSPGVPHDFGGIINHVSHTTKYVVYGLLIALGLSGLAVSTFIKSTARKREPVPVVYT